MPLNSDLNDIEDALGKAQQALTGASEQAQQEIYKAILEAARNIDTKGGRFDRLQSPARIMAEIQKVVEKKLKGDYSNSITRFFDSIISTSDQIITLHEDHNELKGEKRIERIREVARQDLENRLTDSLLPAGDTFRQGYIQPIKNLVFQKVRQGASIGELQKSLELWNKDNPVAQGMKPLQSYTTQISRDAGFQHNGQINEAISAEFGLNGFEYSGGKISNSRPICVHLVNEDRPVLFSELPALLKKYPQGLIPGTTEKNFLINRGGFACRHSAFPVRIKVSK